ncbi:hypothetical protein BLNAU_10482 [Blattamonas nauphoetae]|uniref:Uncharacterized protein n=1 Tax=Blattamonas nauphoetae TaxID=2049346 RepID=A0ABQ9XR39_9EUKA|nr:hypothetical protein BLNAU_10482 [Blattamonas nauphoetae]
MGNVIFKNGHSSSTARSDCSPFLNWNEEELESEDEVSGIYRSLVATVKLKPTLDDSLEAKTVKFLESLDPKYPEVIDALLSNHGRTTDESLTNFVQSIVVLISTPNRVITAAAMTMLENLILWCSQNIRLALVKADLIPQLINTLNPLSLSFTEAINIHDCLFSIITYSISHASSDGLARLGIEDGHEQQAVRETVFQQVLTPSEKYICHLCMNRYSIIEGDQSRRFLELLAQLLEICPYYQPTMEFVLHMPVVPTIPSCLTFFEFERSMFWFLNAMIDAQRYWNETRGSVQQLWKTVHRLLRMEGIEDGIEAKLQNDQNEYNGRWIVAFSIDWNNLQGMNVPKHE